MRADGFHTFLSIFLCSFCLFLRNHLLVVKSLLVTLFKKLVTEGKPENKFDAVFGTKFRIFKHFSSLLQKFT
jgi:hypothetical protein